MTISGAPHEESMWERVYSEVGLADYQIFEETHRKILNDKIIRHYYTREIGVETVARWRMFVRDAMHLIMPYYNQLYESELLALGMEPLGDPATCPTSNMHGERPRTWVLEPRNRQPTRRTSTRTRHQAR